MELLRSYRLWLILPPNTNAMGSLQQGSTIGATASPRPLSAASSYSSLGAPSGNYIPTGLAPPPIMPGSALRLLNQGRAQGLFTPSTSHLTPAGKPATLLRMPRGSLNLPFLPPLPQVNKR